VDHFVDDFFRLLWLADLRDWRENEGRRNEFLVGGLKQKRKVFERLI
jgi:hypothetical protein